MAKRTKVEIGFRGRRVKPAAVVESVEELSAEGQERQAAGLREDVESTGSPLLDERFRRIRMILAHNAEDLARIARGLDRLETAAYERLRHGSRGANVAVDLRNLGARSVCLEKGRTRRGSDSCLEWETRRVVRGIVPEIKEHLLCDGCRFAWHVEMAARIAEEESARRNPP